MERLAVSDAIFETLEGDEPYVLRLFALGSGFASIGLNVVAVVGDVPVERIVVNPDADGFSGLLVSAPADGDRLRVGWSPHTMIDTPITYSAGGGGNV